jgi:hypothetical protein
MSPRVFAFISIWALWFFRLLSASGMKWERAIITFWLFIISVLITQAAWFRSPNLHFCFFSKLHLRMSNQFRLFLLLSNLLLSLRWNIYLWCLFYFLISLSVMSNFLLHHSFDVILFITIVVWWVVTFLCCGCLSTYQINLNLLSLIKYFTKVYIPDLNYI